MIGYDSIAPEAPLVPAVEKLTQSNNVVVRTEAERTRIALGKK